MGYKQSLDRALTDQRGSVLLGVLLLVVAMTFLGIGLFQAATIETGAVQRTEEDVRAFYAADAGLSRTSADLAITEVGTASFDTVLAAFPGTVPAFSGSTSTCFGSATCTSASNPRTPAYIVAASSAGATDRFWLTSTACIPGPAANPCPAGARSAAQLRTYIVKKTTSTMPFGIFGVSTSTNPAVKISGGGTTDSYNSHATCASAPLGYASAPKHQDGDIAANGALDLQGTFKGDVFNYTNVSGTDVKIESTTTVSGNVTYAGAGTILNGGTVSGTISQQAGTAINPSNLQNCSPYPSSMDSVITQYDASGNVVPKSKWTYNSSTGALSIFGSTTVSIVPGNYCLGSIVASGSSVVKITDLTVITSNGMVNMSGSTFANTTNDAQNLQIISTYGNDAGETGTNNFVLSGGAGSYLVAYAPFTKVTISGTASIYGAVVGNVVEVSGGASVHYDEFFKSGCPNKLTVGLPGSGTTYALERWHQLHCSQSSPSSPWACS